MNNPQLRELVEQLDAALDGANRIADEASRLAEQFREKPSELSDEELAEVEQFARGDQAAPELRELQRRIDAGELTWQDIRSGQALDDPGVVQALSAGLPDAQAAYTMLREGHDVDAVIAARADDAPREDQPSPRATEPDWDDSDGYGGGWMDRPSQW
ncbi:hypothetical protein [Saccharopolyspora thermophila]|uniref:hypothetical protein n=1 Tax=Saccharopolyspora thermophila TaxID=89367 RepID=UPI00166ACC8A|nr:hypothetical protein [Saccharopolyspora subtropica]